MADEQQNNQTKKSFFNKIEDTYYRVMEFIEEKLHIPVIKYFVQPIEKKGIPSLPIAIILILAVIGGAFVALGGLQLPAQKIPFSISVMGADGSPIDGAQVTLKGTGFSQTVESLNGIAEFIDVPSGESLLMTIKKSGFSTLTKRIKITEKGYDAKLLAPSSGGESTGELSEAKKKLMERGYTSDQLKGLTDDEARDLLNKIDPLAFSSEEVEVNVKVTEYSGSAIEGATVLYTPGDDTAYTDENGYASFKVPKNADVSLGVSRQGYESETGSMTGYEGATTTIRLRAKQAPANNGGGGEAGSPKQIVPSDPSPENSVIVTIKGFDKDGKEKEVQNAEVILYSENKGELGRATVSSTSQATFENLAVGLKVFAVATATGFKASEPSAIKAIQNGDATKLTLTLNEAKEPSCDSQGNCVAGDIDYLNVKVIDSKNKSVQKASIYFVSTEPGPMQFLPIPGANATTDKNGFAQITANTDSLGRLVILTSTFIAFVSEDELMIGADKNYTATLELATNTTSTSFSVKTVNYYDAPEKNSAITLYYKGIIYPEQKQTDEKGTAEYQLLPVGEKVSAKAEKETYNGKTDTATLQAGKNEATIKLYPATKQITFKAIDAFSGASLSGSFQVYRTLGGSVLLASCNQTTSDGCIPESPLYTSTPLAIKVSAPGYIDRTASTTINPDDNEIIVKMLPKTFDKLVEFRGLCQEDGTNCISPDSEGLATLEVGKTYYAEFWLAITNSTDEAGLLVKVGDKSGLLADDGAIVKSVATAQTDSVWSQTIFDDIKASRSQPKTGCGASESENGLYKTVAVSAKNINDSLGSSLRVVVPITVFSKQRPSLKIYYEAWNHVNGSYLRLPVDEKYAEKAVPADKWCNATTFNTSYKVVDPLASKRYYTCGPKACLSLSYAQETNETGVYRYGANGFVVNVPYTPATEAMTIEYKLTDYSPDPEEESTVFMLSAPKERLSFETPNPYLVNYSGSPQDKQKGFDEKGNSGAKIKAWPIKAGSTIVEVLYGAKLMPTTNVLLLASQFKSAAINTYYVHYNEVENTLEIGIKNDSNEFQKRNAIELNTSPVMPADAVYLQIDYDSMPPQCSEASIHVLPLPACFEYDNTQELLKFDASNDLIGGVTCPYYDKNPNNVKGSNEVNNGPEKLRLAVFCTGVGTQEFDVTITPSDLQTKALVLVRVPARINTETNSAKYARSEIKEKTRPIFAPITCDTTLNYTYSPRNTSEVQIGTAGKWTNWGDGLSCRLSDECKCSDNSADFFEDWEKTCLSDGWSAYQEDALNHNNQAGRSLTYSKNTYVQISNNSEQLPYKATIYNQSTYKTDLAKPKAGFAPTDPEAGIGGAYWQISSDVEAKNFIETDFPEDQETMQPEIYVLVNNRQYGSIDRIRVLIDNFPLINANSESVFRADKPGIISIFASTSQTGMVNITVDDLPSVIDEIATYPNNPAGSTVPFVDVSKLPYDPSYIGFLKRFGENNAFHRGTTVGTDYKPFPLAAFKEDGKVELHWFLDNASIMNVRDPSCISGEGMFDFTQTLDNLKEASFPDVKVQVLKLNTYGGPIQSVCSDPKETTLCGRNYFVLKQEDGSTCIQSAWDSQKTIYGDPLQLPCNNKCAIDDQCNEKNSYYTLKTAFLKGTSYICMRDNPVGFEEAVPQGSCLKIVGDGLTGTEFAAYDKEGKPLVEIDPDEWKDLDKDSKGEFVIESFLAHPDLARALPDLGMQPSTNLPAYAPKIGKHTLSIPHGGTIDADTAVYLRGDYRLAYHDETNRDASDQCYYMPASDEYYCPVNRDYQISRWVMGGIIAVAGITCAAVPGCLIAFGAGWGGIAAYSAASAGASAATEIIISGAETRSAASAFAAGGITFATSFGISMVMASIGQGIGSALGGGTGTSSGVMTSHFVANSGFETSFAMGLSEGMEKAAMEAATKGASQAFTSFTATFATGLAAAGLSGSAGQALAGVKDNKGSPLFLESEGASLSSTDDVIQPIAIAYFADAQNTNKVDQFLEQIRPLAPNLTKQYANLREGFRQNINQTNYKDAKIGLLYQLNFPRNLITYLNANATNEFLAMRQVTKQQLEQIQNSITNIIEYADSANSPEEVADAATMYTILLTATNKVNALYPKAESMQTRHDSCVAKKKQDPEKYADKKCLPCALKDLCTD